MWIRKLFLCGATGILMAGLSVAPVSAHGHHSQAESATEICPLCTLEDCTETGYHIHDDQVYCGYDHSCGYCDGSCNNSCTKQNGCGSSVRSRGHHNRHHG